MCFLKTLSENDLAQKNISNFGFKGEEGFCGGSLLRKVVKLQEVAKLAHNRAVVRAIRDAGCEFDEDGNSFIRSFKAFTESGTPQHKAEAAQTRVSLAASASAVSCSALAALAVKKAVMRTFKVVLSSCIKCAAEVSLAAALVAAELVSGIEAWNSIQRMLAGKTKKPKTSQGPRKKHQKKQHKPGGKKLKHKHQSAEAAKPAEAVEAAEAAKPVKAAETQWRQKGTIALMRKTNGLSAQHVKSGGKFQSM